MTVGPAPYLAQHYSAQDEAGRNVYDQAYTLDQLAYPLQPGGPLTTRYSNDGQGNVQAMVDAKGHSSSYSYETSGWLIGTSQQVTTANGPQTVNTGYGYDLVGNRVSTTDGNTHTATAGFDVLNRPTFVKDGAGNPTIASTNYDDLNRITNRTDGNGNISVYTFDNASRLLSLNTTGGSGTTPLLTTYAYNYNTANLTAMVDTVGNNPAATTSYGNADRLLSTSFNSGQAITSYSYDNSDNLMSETYSGVSGSGNYSTAYGYYARNRLSSWQRIGSGAGTYDSTLSCMV